MNDFPTDSHLNFTHTAWMDFLLGQRVQKLFQLIKCSLKFSCSSNVTQQQKKIYFTTSTGSSQDVPSKLKEVKLISEVWQLDVCTWLHTHIQTNTPRPTHQTQNTPDLSDCEVPPKKIISDQREKKDGVWHFAFIWQWQ